MFEFTLECKRTGRSECPPDAGPAWRECREMGVDMHELEENLRLTPWERLVKNDKLLNEWLHFEAFMEELNRGWNFIRLQHGHPHQT